MRIRRESFPNRFRSTLICGFFRIHDLLPLFLNVQVYHAMLEVGASEQAVRMTAMDNATKACKDMIKDLTRLYNKARQAAVTNELIDIVGGAEALKG